MSIYKKIDYKVRASSEYKWLFYDDGSCMFFKTKEEALKYGKSQIHNYLDDAWNEEVEALFIAEVIFTTQQTNRTDKPSDDELDEEGCDSDGQYWGEFEYTCDYELKALEESNNE